ncbi:MAG TPA: ABC transporter ATP-binding protein [Chloroflexia bacterium]|nr:ABC transporter ATP-binding protein [Chloroflexia bacterium]
MTGDGRVVAEPGLVIPTPAAPAGRDVIVEARDVHKTYDTGAVQVHALRGISLQIFRGEMAAIMGPSGCGKTTLLNCLAGLDGIDSGEVLIDNVPLHKMSDRQRTDLRARKMGFVFQFYNLLPVLSAIENVELPMLVSGSSAADARKRAAEALDMVSLSDRATHRPAELSGGQQQRVTIARALANNPAIIWADEPTGDLDSETSAEIMDLLHRLNKQNGQTFVLVTHAPEIGSQADRIIRMRDGLITDYGLGQAPAQPHPAEIAR